MKILEIKSKSGMLTELQSDTIFGHFCWRLKERLGEEKLLSFISAYHNNKPIFILSDGLVKITKGILFPKPFLFQRPERKELKKEKIKEFINRKNTKENKFLNAEQLNNFLKKGIVQSEQNRNDSEQGVAFIQEMLKVSVQIDRESSTSVEDKLFSYNPKYTKEDVTYVILINILDETLYQQYDCENILHDVFEIGYGKKKSSGFGHFEIVRMDTYSDIIEPDDANAFMVLGNYLPSENDFVTPIGYDFNTKYGKFGEDKSQSKNPFKNPIVMFTAGSCFKTSSVNSKYYGRVTDAGEISGFHHSAVQFGCPFFLKFKYNE